ncbi:MAG: MFS transporter [Actinomycetota bacterium]|nr:MFS transporter [Actinomycetota bacterium]
MDATREMDRRSIAVLSAGHGCVDICQGAIPALMPFLVIRRGYSYSEATALLLVMTFSSSMLQPLFGHFSDRRSLAWLLPGGILLGGAGTVLVGFATSFELTLAAVCISGIGVGAYHPEGARFANYVAGERRATGMSFYAVGGNVGFALGPVAVTALVLPLGITGIAWIALPITLAAVLLAAELPRLKRFRPEADPTPEESGAEIGTEIGPGFGTSSGATVSPVTNPGSSDPLRDRWLPFSGVAAIAGFRSATYFALQAFIPLWFIQHLNESTAVGNGALTALLVSGAIGTLVGGRVADRIGKRRVITISLSVTTPLILLFLLLGPAPAIVLLAAIGFFMVGTFSITVVLGQEYLPARVGLASGVTLGAAIGFGGLIAWLLGLLADQTSLLTVLLVTAALPLPGILFTWLLPPTKVEEK